MPVNSRTQAGGGRVYSDVGYQCVPIPFLLLCSAAAAQPAFTFDDSTNSATLQLAGDARLAGKVLRLTPSRRDQAGAAWFPEKQPILAGFDTSFRFQFTQQGGLGRGADGLAFVVQSIGPEAVGGAGNAGGFAAEEGIQDRLGIPNSIAIFFDTYKNDESKDPSANYAAICANPGSREMRWPAPRLAFVKKLRVNLKDRKVHTARVVYKPPIVSVFLDDMKTPVLTSTADFSIAVDRAGSGYVGFTASTGGGFENHDVIDWQFGSMKPDVSSAMVTSNVSFLKNDCLPDRNLCTPAKAAVEETGAGRYHVVLPAHLEWGASVPNPAGRKAVITNAVGAVCWDVKSRGAEGCGGPAKALVTRNRGGRTWFSVNDRNGAFGDNEGYFEFDVEVR